MGKLALNKDNKKISGVCAGLADFFELDLKQVRRAFVFLGFFGPGMLIYISLAIALRKNAPKQL